MARKSGAATVTESRSASSSDHLSDVSPAGKIYQPMVSALLAAEYDRRKKIESRGSTLVTASATLATVILGLTALITGKDRNFTNGLAVSCLIAALFCFLVSAILGLVVGTLPLPYTTVGRATLGQLTDDEFWTLSADDALREDVYQLGTTIQSLRVGNQRMAMRVRVSLAFQVLAAVLLTFSVSIDLRGRTTLLSVLSECANQDTAFWLWSMMSLN